MSHDEAALYHSNGYNAQAACEHCDGIIRHERWCQTRNPVVGYAYKLWFLPMNWRSETRLSSTRSAFCGAIATSEFKTHRSSLSKTVLRLHTESKSDEAGR